eukprot:g11987.t2
MTVTRFDDQRYGDLIIGRFINSFSMEYCYFTPEPEAALLGGRLDIPTLNIIGTKDQYFGPVDSVAKIVADNGGCSIWELHRIWQADSTLRSLVQLVETTASEEAKGKRVTLLMVPNMKFPNHMTLKEIERTHRDATSQVGATLQKLQKSLFDEEMGKVDFASAIALLNELPQRLEAVEENTRTLVARVNKLNSDPLKRVSTRGSIAPVSGPREFEIHDKPGDQQQEEAFVKRLASFDVAFQEAGLANAEEIAYRFHAQVRELEGIYARAAGLEEGLQNVEEHLAKSLQGIDDWKAAFSVRLDDLEGRIDQAKMDH